jgi:hypothetical protein
MRECVKQFLNAVAIGFELDGPAALIAADTTPYTVDASIAQLFSGGSFTTCRVPTSEDPADELLLPELTLAPESLQVLICLDLVRRFDEAKDLLEQAITRLAPGGLVLLTADIAEARPAIGLSRVLTPLGLERLVAKLDAAVVGWQGDVDFPKTLFLIAGPKPSHPLFAQRAGKFLELFQTPKSAPAATKPWHSKLFSPWNKSAEAAAAPPDESLSFSIHLPSAVNWKEALLELPRSTG